MSRNPGVRSPSCSPPLRWWPRAPPSPSRRDSVSAAASSWCRSTSPSPTAGKYVTDLNEERVRGLRGRRQAEADVLLARRSSRSRWRSCSTPAPAWTSAWRSRRRRRSASPGSCGRRTRPKSSTSTARSRILQAFTNDAAALEKAIRSTTPNGSTSLYNAIYISLKELKKVKAPSTDRHPPPGDRPAVGRRRHVEPDRVRGSARSGQAIRNRDLRDRPARRRAARREFKEAEFVLKQLANETGGRAFFVDGRAELPKIYQAIWDELSSQYAIAYSSGTRSATAPGAASRSASPRPGLHGAHQAGLLRPDGSQSMTIMHLAPAGPLRRGRRGLPRALRPA